MNQQLPNNEFLINSDFVKNPFLGINTKSSVDYQNKLITFEDGSTRQIDFSQKDKEWIVIPNEEDMRFQKYLRLTTARRVLFSEEKREAYINTKESSTKEIKLNEKKSLEYNIVDDFGNLISRKSKSKLIPCFVLQYPIYKNTQIVDDFGNIKNVKVYFENLNHKMKYDRTNAQHRTCLCHFALSNIHTQEGKKASKTSDKSLSIYKKIDNEDVFSVGQFKCSSVWTCPLCSSIITEGRKNYIAQAFEQHRKNGGAEYEIKDNKIIEIKPSNNGIYLFTLTLPHYKKSELDTLMQNIRLALKYFKESRIYVQSLKKFGYLGEIRALEVTWSEANGWHPHFHSIMFFNSLMTELDMILLHDSLLPAWQSACLRAGLNEPNWRGIDIQDGSQAQKYVNKWGIEHEVSKWTSKKGKKEKETGVTSYTPFQLLDLYRETDSRTEKSLYRGLFNEYSEAFHGFRQLYWSPKLKEHFGITEESDEELNTESTEESVFLGSLTEQDWEALRSKYYSLPTQKFKIPFTFAINKYVKENGFSSLKKYAMEIQAQKIEVEDIEFNTPEEKKEAKILSHGQLREFWYNNIPDYANLISIAFKQEHYELHLETLNTRKVGKNNLDILLDKYKNSKDLSENIKSKIRKSYLQSQGY